MAGDETELTTAGAEGARAAVNVSGAFAAAALHSGDGWEAATDAVIADLDLSQAPELGLVFVDSRFAADYGRVLARLRSATGVRHLVGASGQGVIGPGIEAEERPAVSMLALSLPKLEVTTLAIGPDDEALAALERVAGTPVRAWLLFADPFSADAEALVRAIEKRQPDTPVLGGLASAHNLQSGTAVFLDGAVLETGAVLVGIRGDFRVHTVVAQGAEPVGQPWTVTDCEGNVVRSIGSRPALEVLQETLAELDEETRQRAQQNLLVGLAMDEYRHQHVRGDFLIRNVLGGDRETGAIAINAIPHLGQTFQFQFRDARAADLDLSEQLAAFRSRLLPGETVLGALLCACNGRGQGLFGTPHHDARALAEELGPVPTAGLFCSGEIGPVAGAAYLHGFTASIALLTTRSG